MRPRFYVVAFLCAKAVILLAVSRFLPPADATPALWLALACAIAAVVIALFRSI